MEIVSGPALKLTEYGGMEAGSGHNIDAIIKAGDGNIDAFLVTQEANRRSNGDDGNVRGDGRQQGLAPQATLRHLSFMIFPLPP